MVTQTNYSKFATQVMPILKNFYILHPTNAIVPLLSPETEALNKVCYFYD